MEAHMNWTEQQEHTDVQHSLEGRRTMISYMPQKMLTSEKKNLSLMSVKAMCFTTSKKK